MRPDDFDVQKIIETCQGTCMETLQSALDWHYPSMDESELTKENHDQIDNQIFLCEECGWWCETSQYGEEDGKCSDCSPEEEDY